MPKIDPSDDSSPTYAEAFRRQALSAPPLNILTNPHVADSLVTQDHTMTVMSTLDTPPAKPSSPAYHNALRHLTEMLEFTYQIEVTLDGKFVEFMREITQLLKATQITWLSQKVGTASPRSAAPLNHEARANPHFWAACVCLACAYDTHRKDNVDATWKMITTGFYWYGRHSAGTTPGASSKGGAARAAKFTPLKEKVAELLATKAPEGGWKSAADAARQLTSDIEALIQEMRIPPSKSNLQSLIQQWCSPGREPEIHQAFYAHCSPTCREKIDRKKNQRY